MRPRAMWIGWLFHLKTLTRSGLFMLASVVIPLIIASIAFFMFEAGGPPETLLWAAFGAGFTGIWAATLTGAGSAIQWQRWQGTLEILIVTPTPFLFVLLPLTLATSTMGLYSLTATLVWGRLVFGVPFDLAHPVLFAVSVIATVLGLGLLGLVLAATFILYRQANALSNLFNYPVYLATGLLVPLSLLPEWVTPVSWFVAPTWGIQAVRDAALGGDALLPLGLLLALSAAYLVLGAALLAYFERLARERATISLT